MVSKRPEQNGCPWNGARYGVDVVARLDGSAYDLLIDAGGENAPAWNPIAPIPLGLWREPVPTGEPDPAPPAPPAPIPAPPTVDLQPVLDQLAIIRERLIMLEIDHAESAKRMAELQAGLDILASRPFPAYQGRFLGWPVVLTPR